MPKHNPSNAADHGLDARIRNAPVVRSERTPNEREPAPSHEVAPLSDDPERAALHLLSVVRQVLTGTRQVEIDGARITVMSGGLTATIHVTRTEK